MKSGGPEKSSNKHGKASQVAPVVKNLPVNAGDASNESLIPGSGRSPGVGNGNPLTVLAKIPRTEEPGGLDRVHGVAKSWTWLGTHVC